MTLADKLGRNLEACEMCMLKSYGTLGKPDAREALTAFGPRKKLGNTQKP